MAEQSTASNPGDQLGSPLARAQPPLHQPPFASNQSPLGRLPTRTPLVGRTTELDYLKGQFEAMATGGGGRLLFISGEPGVGKTRLARELGLYARRCGALFLEGHYLRDGTPAYGPWVEALRPGLRDVTREELAQMVGSYGPELFHAVPELVEPLGPFAPPPPLPPEDQRRRLYDGLTGLVLTLSQRTPLALLLDDLQWAPGLGLLEHLARRLGESRALILGAYREQEFTERPVLVREWAELNRTRLVTQVPLAPFTEAETGELVAHYFGELPAAQLRQPMYRQTRGNAFYVEEVVRSLAESGAVRAGPTGWEVADPSRVSIPQSMKLAIEERVTRVGDAVREVLAQAAVLGQEFSFPALRTLTGRSEDELIEVIDRAVAARLLLDRSAPGEERLAFLDDQVQEVLYTGIPPLRRHRYHLRAGQALEEVYADRLEAQLEELARHFAEGNEAPKAAEYALRAAQKNVRLFHWPRARQFYERGLAALAQLPDTTDTRRRRVDTILNLVSAAFVTGHPEQNLRRLAQAEVLARDLPGPDGAGPDHLRLARVQFWMGRVHYTESAYRAAREYYEQALASARASGDDEIALLSSSAIGRALFVQGYPGQATSLLTQVIARLDRTASAWEWIVTVGYLAQARAASGDYATALTDGQRALTRARATNDPGSLVIAYLSLTIMYFLGGDLQQTVEASRAAVQAAEESGAQRYIYIGLGFQAWAESRLGHDDLACTTLASLKAVGGSLGGRLAYSDWFAAAEAGMALNADRIEEACTLAEKAVAQAREVGGIFAEGLAQRVWGQVLARRIPAQEAQARTVDWGERCPHPTPYLRREGPGTRAYDEAEAHFASSLRCFEEGDARLEAARTRVAWGLLCRDRGDAAVACAHLEKAAAQLEASGLTGELERTRLAFQGLDRNVKGSKLKTRERGGAAYPAKLTRREVQVLRLIAAGRTNNQIAAELVISVPTVESHITRIYEKIGAGGRAEATAFALKHELV